MIIGIAGDTTAKGSGGGNLELYAGDGLSADEANGGRGGNVVISAGIAYGLSPTLNSGGNVTVMGGNASASTGGRLTFTSGIGAASTSGEIIVGTANAGTTGVSGESLSREICCIFAYLYMDKQ
jgi:hypothetical protein